MSDQARSMTSMMHFFNTGNHSVGSSSRSVGLDGGGAGESTPRTKPRAKSSNEIISDYDMNDDLDWKEF